MTRAHWDRKYLETDEQELSWHQPEPSLSLELMNLTNEPRVAYQPIYGNFREDVSYGRRACVGVRYKF